MGQLQEQTFPQIPGTDARRVHVLDPGDHGLRLFHGAAGLGADILLADHEEAVAVEIADNELADLQFPQRQVT